MHENVLPIDLPMVVVHYQASERDDRWSSLWPVGRGGEVVVELLEVMNIVEGQEAINKAGREDAWRPDTPISPVRTPVTPLRLRLFDHHRRHRRHHHHRLQNGYADTALPSSRSSTHTRAVRSSRFRQRIASTRGRGIAPATTDSAR